MLICLNMSTDIIKLLCVILLLNCAISKRISESKCDKLLSSGIDSKSLHPYAMEIVEIKQTDKPQSEIIPICFGTLITERFVLTSTECICTVLQPGIEFRVRKFKLDVEPDSDNQLFSVKQSIVQHSKFTNNGIGLMQLNEAIPYRNITSMFKPLCLWTKSTPRLSFTWSIYGNMIYKTADEKWDKKAAVKAVTILENNECSANLQNFSKIYPPNTIKTHMCVKSNDRKFTLLSGGAIVAKLKNQSYLVGITSAISFKKDYTAISGTKVDRFVGWIESVVWPDHTIQETEFVCGQRKVKHKPLITFGKPSYHGEFPWHVALYRIKGRRRNNHKYICGGTIINDQTIMTAAHCVSNEQGLLQASRLIVVAGTYDLNTYPIDARYYGVEAIKVHKKYNRHYLENDIALLKINGVIVFSNYIQPICIRNSSDFNNSVTAGVVAGWGLDERNRPSNVLLKATLPIHDSFNCRESNRDFFPTYLNDNNYCAGYQNGTNVCSGDSGSGMIFESESRWYIRGIVSLGVAVPNSSRCDVVQMVLLTDVQKFYDWIMNTIYDFENQ